MSCPTAYCLDPAASAHLILKLAFGGTDWLKPQWTKSTKDRTGATRAAITECE